MLIFARFTAANQFYFGTGLEDWLKENLPQVQLLDMDSGSDKSYALQLADAAAAAPFLAIWVQAEDPAAPLGTVAAILEAWVRFPGPKMLLLLGEHTQVERMGKAGSGTFCKGKTADELKPELLQFFRTITSPA